MNKDEFVKRSAIDACAKEIATEIRMHVRDRFTPGSLESLDDLEKLVYEKTVEVLTDSHGHFSCVSCMKDIFVARVRCPACKANRVDGETTDAQT